jgi:hypothetical protein
LRLLCSQGNWRREIPFRHAGAAKILALLLIRLSWFSRALALDRYSSVVIPIVERPAVLAPFWSRSIEIGILGR